jgi:hypothetical protein
MEGPGEHWLQVADMDGDGAAELLVLAEALTFYKLR